jgi:hypothetical protein
MGDRVSIGFKMDEDNILYLYQHWGGHQHQRRLAEALEAAGPRLTDPSYATRIVISRLIGDDWQSLTGHGLLVNSCDSEYPIHVIDFVNGIISLHDEDVNAPRGIIDEPIMQCSIKEFVEAELALNLATSSL